jgi:hypothetical protein
MTYAEKIAQRLLENMAPEGVHLATYTNIDTLASAISDAMEAREAMTKESMNAALALAFEAGKWVGQVELEEHFDKQQYGQAVLEVAYSRRSAMPLLDASSGRTVTVNLRSDAWRNGVRKSAQEYLEKALSRL